jgi:hypothetical protein
MSKPQTQRVVFRKWKSNGQVIAFFLDQVYQGYVMSYEHVGQHGSACYPHPQTEPTTPAEYTPLWKELTERVGYRDLRIVKRGKVDYSKGE